MELADKAEEKFCLALISKKSSWLDVEFDILPLLTSYMGLRACTYRQVDQPSYFIVDEGLVGVSKLAQLVKALATQA